MRELSLERTLKAHPEIYHHQARRKKYRQLELNIGGGPTLLELGRFDHEMIAAYTEGGCIELAFALAEASKQNNPKFLLITLMDHPDIGWGGHLAWMIDEEHVLDAHGVRPASKVVDAYKNNPRVRQICPDPEYAVLNWREVLEVISGEEYRDDPVGDRFAELEALVTRDFAKRLLRQAKSPLYAPWRMTYRVANRITTGKNWEQPWNLSPQQLRLTRLIRFLLLDVEASIR